MIRSAVVLALISLAAPPFALFACASAGTGTAGVAFRYEGCLELSEGMPEVEARTRLEGDPVEDSREPDGLTVARWYYSKGSGSGVGAVGTGARLARRAGVPLAREVGAVAGSASAQTETGQSFECVVTFRGGEVETFSYSRGREHREDAGF